MVIRFSGYKSIKGFGINFHLLIHNRFKMHHSLLTNDRILNWENLLKKKHNPFNLNKNKDNLEEDIIKKSNNEIIYKNNNKECMYKPMFNL